MRRPEVPGREAVLESGALDHSAILTPHGNSLQFPSSASALPGTRGRGGNPELRRRNAKTDERAVGADPSLSCRPGDQGAGAPPRSRASGLGPPASGLAATPPGTWPGTDLPAGHRDLRDRTRILQARLGEPVPGRRGSLRDPFRAFRGVPPVPDNEATGRSHASPFTSPNGSGASCPAGSLGRRGIIRSPLSLEPPGAFQLHHPRGRGPDSSYSETEGLLFMHLPPTDHRTWLHVYPRRRRSFWFPSIFVSFLFCLFLRRVPRLP
ncbi:uncharacterized protein LOC125102586 [Lutra lutra]|uniref:uncharacterized protein LOC125102586 n=1 Tax=Lutra lutra TaxID=9657 RepID=UPI001FD3A7D9|nr:uncharacterized protein LOC125102586 [Lutra lutra]